MKRTNSTITALALIGTVCTQFTETSCLVANASSRRKVERKEEEETEEYEYEDDNDNGENSYLAKAGSWLSKNWMTVAGGLAIGILGTKYIDNARNEELDAKIKNQDALIKDGIDKGLQLRDIQIKQLQAEKADLKKQLSKQTDLTNYLEDVGNKYEALSKRFKEGDFELDVSKSVKKGVCKATEDIFGSRIDGCFADATSEALKDTKFDSSLVSEDNKKEFMQGLNTNVLSPTFKKLEFDNLADNTLDQMATSVVDEIVDKLPENKKKGLKGELSSDENKRKIIQLIKNKLLSPTKLTDAIAHNLSTKVYEGIAGKNGNFEYFKSEVFCELDASEKEKLFACLKNNPGIIKILTEHKPDRTKDLGSFGSEEYWSSNKEYYKEVLNNFLLKVNCHIPKRLEDVAAIVISCMCPYRNPTKEVVKNLLETYAKTVSINGKESFNVDDCIDVDSVVKKIRTLPPYFFDDFYKSEISNIAITQASGDGTVKLPEYLQHVKFYRDNVNIQGGIDGDSRVSYDSSVTDNDCAFVEKCVEYAKANGYLKDD